MRTFIEIRKRQILKYLKRYIGRNNFSPTQQEMSKVIGLSPRHLRTICKAMKQDGMIDFAPKAIRGIKLTSQI